MYTGWVQHRREYNPDTVQLLPGYNTYNARVQNAVPILARAVEENQQKRGEFSRCGMWEQLYTQFACSSAYMKKDACSNSKGLSNMFSKNYYKCIFQMRGQQSARSNFFLGHRAALDLRGRA
jgi:hypothetical protein